MVEKSVFSDLTRRQVLQRGAAGGAALTAAGLLAACGGSGTESTTSPSGAKPKKGGTLRVAVIGGEGGSSAIDPNGAYNQGSLVPQIQIFESLIERKPNYERIMVAAESVEPNGAGTVWTIRLKQGLEWHNGKSVEADDLIYTVNRWAKSEQFGSVYALMGVKRLRKLDPRTVEMQLEAPSAIVPDVLAYQLGSQIVPQGFDPQNPVGCGPFKLVSYTPGKETVLERFPNYPGPGPYLDRLELIQFPEPTPMVNALLSGEVDVAEQLPPAQVKVVEGGSGLKTVVSPPSFWKGFYMRLDSPQFKDQRVREAMRLLVNRQEIVDQAFGGFGKIGNDIYSIYDPGYNHELPQREQDIEQAQSLLKQAGMEDEKFELSASAVSAGLVEMSQVFAQQCKEAGVNLTVKNIPVGSYYNNYPTGYAMSITNWSMIPYLIEFASSEAPGAPYAETGVNDPQLNKLYAEAIGEMDEAKRNELIGAMQKIEWESGGYINPSFTQAADGMKANVEGLVPDKSGNNLRAWHLKYAWLA